MDLIGSMIKSGAISITKKNSDVCVSSETYRELLGLLDNHIVHAEGDLKHLKRMREKIIGEVRK